MISGTCSAAVSFGSPLLAAPGSFKPVFREAFPLAWREIPGFVSRHPPAAKSFCFIFLGGGSPGHRHGRAAVLPCLLRALKSAFSLTHYANLFPKPSCNSSPPGELGSAADPTPLAGGARVRKAFREGSEEERRGGGRCKKQISAAPLSDFPFSPSRPPFTTNTKENRKIIFADSPRNARLKQTPCEGSMHYLWLSVLYAIPHWMSKFSCSERCS